MIRGGLFVIEPWMMGGEWSRIGCGGYNDEFECMTKNPSAQAGFEDHWANWISQADIQQIKNYGLNTVRIPVGYWIVDGARDASDPYAKGGFKYLKQLLRWCADAGIYAIIDLHAAPGVSTPNQQFAGKSVSDADVGFYNEDNFGRAKYWAWNITTSKVNDPDFAAVFAIEALNEPWTKSSGSPSNKGLITSYYPTFHTTVRDTEEKLGVKCSNTGSPYKRAMPFGKRASYTDCLNIVYMAANWGSGDSSTFLPSLSHVIFDSHRYFAYSEQGSAADVLSNSCNTAVAKEDPEPVMIGEFSLALPNNDGDFSQDNTDFYRKFFANQAYVAEQGIGSTFWTYKCEVGASWCYTSAVEKGFIPTNAADGKNGNTC
ncbi:glycoside hydrolase family 5 protein [Atractiella rhizophila]|nr:glycoside hydrolase family 5 protein [Atractiella rhizophila]